MPFRPAACAVAAALSLVPAGTGLSQSGDPEGETEEFTTAMDVVLVEAGEASSLLRCAALFRAFRLYAGDDSEIGATATEHETGLAVTAVIIWQEETGTRDLDTAFEAIVPMVTEATELFLSRMAANDAEAGLVFDDALRSELTFCDTLHDELASADLP